MQSSVDDSAKKNRGTKQFFEILKDNFLHLVALNLLFIISSLPVVTIGATLAGLNHVLKNYCMGIDDHMGKDFLKGVVKNFRQSNIVTFINLLVALILYINYKFYINTASPELKYVGLSFGIAFSIIFSIMNIFIYPMLVTYKFKLKQLYKNAFIFTVIKFPHNMAVFLALITIHFIFIRLHYVLYAFLGFSLPGLVVNFYARNVFYRYIDFPYRKRG